jgi:hypothetical protein
MEWTRYNRHKKLLLLAARIIRAFKLLAPDDQRKVLRIDDTTYDWIVFEIHRVAGQGFFTIAEDPI